jgi:glycosyltransferase 2 family protein
VRRAAAWFARNFRWIAAVATAVGIAVAVYAQWDAIVDFDWSLPWWLIVSSVLAFAAAPIVQGFSFWLILRLLGGRARLDEAMVVWSRSFLLRYAPSGALAIVVRVRERDRLAASREQILVATAYEQLAALLAGALASVVCFAAAGFWPHWLALAIGLPGLALAVAVRPAFAGRLLHALLVRRGLDVPRLLRGRQLALATALNVPAWAATGLGAWLLVDGMESSKDAGYFWLTAVYALAWLVGFVLPALPGGLGARDGMLVALLAARFGAGVASALAIGVRLANTVGEFIAIGLVEAGYRAWRATRVRTGAPELPSSGLDSKTVE